jgi:signal transduction histidine kinase
MRPDVELALFRVVQESLTNIHRHSGSRNAKIRIDRNEQFTLEISDPGGGLPSSCPPASGYRQQPEIGVGLSSMQERVKLIGGRLDVDFAAHGTKVRVTIPLEGATT